MKYALIHFRSILNPNKWENLSDCEVLVSDFSKDIKIILAVDFHQSNHHPTDENNVRNSLYRKKTNVVKCVLAILQQQISGIHGKVVKSYNFVKVVLKQWRLIERSKNNTEVHEKIYRCSNDRRVCHYS